MAYDGSKYSKHTIDDGRFSRRTRTSGDSLEEALKRIKEEHFLETDDDGNLPIFKEEQMGEVAFCEAGYAFILVLEDGFDYQVRRCDGGHHIGIIKKKNPREKDDDREITIGTNGEPEMAESEEDNFTIN